MKIAKNLIYPAKHIETNKLWLHVQVIYFLDYPAELFKLC